MIGILKVSSNVTTAVSVQLVLLVFSTAKNVVLLIKISFLRTGKNIVEVCTSQWLIRLALNSSLCEATAEVSIEGGYRR